MHIVLGGTGRVGSAVARALLRRGEPATVVTRDAARAEALRRAGAEIAVADIRDAARLRAVFRTGRRAFLLNPPADPSSDTDAEERANVASILEALEGSGLEKIVAASTYGARPGERCGDLTVLHAFERSLRAQPIPAAINRGAFYMSNWLGMVDASRESGALLSFFPADFALSMAAPEDLGEAAARRLLEPLDDVALRHVEGPDRYTPQDVAAVFAEAFGKPVAVETPPRAAWAETFAQFGFSEPAAKSYACMTAAVLDDLAAPPDPPERGPTSLRAYLLSAVAASGEA